ncbi:MAG: FAD-dependent oxidoreductase, partial [Humibacter sp.]
MDQSSWDVIIVGGGPAGLSAALLLGRSRRRVLVIDAGSPRNRFAAHVHGILGNEDVAPADLIARGRTEAAAYGVEFASGSIACVERKPDLLRITDADGTERTARAMIV